MTIIVRGTPIRTAVSTHRQNRGEPPPLEAVIAQNQGIADISGLREALLTQMRRQTPGPMPFPVEVQMRNRAAHLRPFRPFFQRLLTPHSANARLRSLVQNLTLAADLGWNAREFRLVPSALDRRFNDPDDLLEPIFAAIFQDQETDLLSQWMEALDAQVSASSNTLLATMDRARSERRGPLRRDVILVGGGPLTSIAASILGAYFYVTVITDQNGIGYPWRTRPLYINSSAQITDFNGAPLPHLGGSTTRIIGRQQFNSLDIDLLLGGDTKSVSCADGRVVEYVAGPRMGDLIATNILLHADAYLIQQRVEVARTQYLTDGRVRLVLIDTETGMEREIEASSVFFLTGPGPERSKISHGYSPVSEREAAQLETSLTQARRTLSWCREAWRVLKQEPSLPGLQTQAQWVSRQIAQTKIALPRVLTLTAMEKLYTFWWEQGSDPESFPLRDLLTTPARIAYLGNGDTMRTLKELVEGRGPACCYPNGLVIKIGQSTIYNERACSIYEYDLFNRRRYRGTFTIATQAIPSRVRRYRIKEEASRVEVVHEDRRGIQRRRLYQSVFDCTGLEQRPLEERLPSSCSLKDLRDLEGKVVGRGNDALSIVGAATGQRASTFPQELQTIIQTLGIAENTLSLWVNGLFAERLAYTFAATHPHTKWPTQRTLLPS